MNKITKNQGNLVGIRKVYLPKSDRSIYELMIEEKPGMYFYNYFFGSIDENLEKKLIGNPITLTFGRNNGNEYCTISVGNFYSTTDCPLPTNKVTEIMEEFYEVLEKQWRK